MPTNMTLKLGEFQPKSKPKFLEIPKFQADFDIDLDTGTDLTDDLVKKQMEKVAPKIFKRELDNRLKMIESACLKVDKDIGKKFKDHLKKHKINPKAKHISAAQKTAHDKFLDQINKLVKALQGYLEKIVQGINTLDSKKWIEEATNLSFDTVEKKIEKAAKGADRRQMKRSAGGRAKIVILAVVAVVATGLLIVGTVLTGGAVLVAVGAIVAASIAIIGVLGKTVIDLINSRGKLLKSVAKLKKEAESVKKAVDDASKVPTRDELDAKMLKKYGLTPTDYTKHAGDDKLHAKGMYKALSGKKRLFSQFDVHYKDVEAYGMKLSMGVLTLQKKNNELTSECAKLVRQAEAAIKDPTIKPKAAAGFMKKAKEIEQKIQANDQMLAKEKQAANNLVGLLKDCAAIKKNMNDLGIVKSKISGSLTKMSQVETGFTTLETVGKQIGSAGSGMKGLTSNSTDWYVVQ